MKKSLITLVAALAVGLFAFAETGMYVKLKNGETFRHNVDDVEEVVFAEIQGQNPIFKFTKLTNNTASVGVAPRRTPTGPITIPSEAEIDGKIYKVTHIEALGFHYCQEVTKIVIPSSVTSIGDCAFINCLSLTRINIPSNVTSIGIGVFAGCVALKDITIPSSVTNIGDHAFGGCWELKDLTIPSSVTSIGDSAFYDCKNLDLVINNTERNVTVGSNAFEECKSVTWEIPDEESTGLQFEVSGTTAMVANGDYSKLDSAFIPSKVKIDGNVYTVTGIVNNAFYNCKSLTYLKVSGGVANMGVSTFSGCENLETVVLGDGIKKISNSLFNGCTSLSDINIPASVTEIEGSAFGSCTSLTSIDIPANVTNIVEYAFDGCKNLASINVDDKNRTYASVDGVLYNKEKTILIQAPGKIQGVFTIPSGVTNIASGAFALCEGLTGLEIPASVTSISEYAFENCTGLTNVTIPSSVKNIDYKAFAGCENLDVVIRNAEEDVTVGSGALKDCKSVTWKIIDESESPLKFKVLTETTAEVTKESCVEGSVTIPSKVVIDGKTYSVVSIAYEAFDNCKGLTNITIPSSVIKIESRAFASSGLTTIELPSSITSIDNGLFSSCSDLVSVKIPSSVESIGQSAFSNCTSLTNLELPSSVKSIGDMAFYNCTGLTNLQLSVESIGIMAFDGCTGLTNLQLSSSVKSIGSGAFRGCTGLTKLELSSSVKSIGSSAFYGCENLDLVIDNSEDNVEVASQAFQNCKSVTWEIPDKESTGLQFEVSGTTAMVAKGDYSKLDSAFIPSKVKINGNVYTVTGIVNNAFYNCKSLTYLKVSGGVANMGVSTFSGCENLETVVLGDGIKKISNSLFNGCTSLSDINIPASVTEIEGSAFGSCTSLTSIDIPANVTNIVEYAFDGCKNLASINVDDKNRTYASVDGVLYNKEKTILIQAPGKIQGVFTIPSGVTNIASGAFALCEGLTGLEIPASVTSISEYAFENCTGLTNVTIPSSVKNIDYKAFSGCKNLDLVISNAKENVTVKSGALDDCKSVTWKK